MRESARRGEIIESAVLRYIVGVGDEANHLATARAEACGSVARPPNNRCMPAIIRKLAAILPLTAIAHNMASRRKLGNA